MYRMVLLSWVKITFMIHYSLVSAHYLINLALISRKGKAVVSFCSLLMNKKISEMEGVEIYIDRKEM